MYNFLKNTVFTGCMMVCCISLSGSDRVIFNNDGSEVFFMPVKEPAVENFLKLRHHGLRDKKVNVISYCAADLAFYSDSVNGNMANHPRAGKAISSLRQKGTDMLAESVKFAHANGMQSFWSMRMNDCHDIFKGCEDLAVPVKKQHPEYLFGSASSRPPYGFWSGFDYGRADVRKMVEKLITEVMEKYDIDGIDLDFCRHWTFFKSAAAGRRPSQQEMDGLTDMLRNIRKTALRAGKRRSRPVKICVRVLDSVEACRAQGIDLARWCSEGIVDMVAGGSEIRLNQPDYLGKLAKKYPEVKFYMVQTEAQISGQHPVLLRNRSILNFRGQAAAAYAGGVYGIYSFNEYFPHLESSKYLAEIHDPELLAGLNKIYYFSHSYTPAERHGRHWERFQKMPSLTPAAPEMLSTKGITLDLFLGREKPGAKLRLLLDTRTVPPDNIQAEFNGVPLGMGEALDTLVTFSVPENALKPGLNKVKIKTVSAPEPELLFSGRELLRFGVNQGLWRRLYGSSGFVPGKSEAIVEDACKLADVSNSGFSNLAHPLNAVADGRIEISFEAKILNSTAPDAMVLRLADDKNAETIQFTRDGIALRNGGQSFKFDAHSAFHKYRALLSNGTLAVYVDGKEVMKTLMNTPCTKDAAIVVDKAEEKPGWLGRSSLILGSLSVRGESAALFRNFTMFNNRQAGRIFDGALLVIHNPGGKDIPALLADPVKLPKDGRDVTVPLSPQNRGGWKTLSFNKDNFKVQSGSFLLDNRKAGPMLRHELTDAGKVLEINFSFKALEPSCPKAQLSCTAIVNGAAGQSQLFSYRFGHGYVRFLDEAMKKFSLPADGIVRCRLLIEPARGIADLYVNGSKIPVLRNRPFITTRQAQAVIFGDGSVAIEGVTELYEAKITVRGMK